MSSTSSTGPLSGATTVVKTTKVETTHPATTHPAASTTSTTTADMPTTTAAASTVNTNLAGPTAKDKAAAAMTSMSTMAGDAAASLSTTASGAAAKISASASAAAHSVQESLSNFDKQHHISSQLSDMTSAASASLKHGHPLNAIANAPAAAKIGETERRKHEQGPISDSAHSASSTEPKESSAIESNTFGDKVSDVASHMKAAISQGKPGHAITNAGTAAMIGQVEREKHMKGPLPETAVDSGASSPALSSTTTSSTISTGV